MEDLEKLFSTIENTEVYLVETLTLGLNGLEVNTTFHLLLLLHSLGCALTEEVENCWEVHRGRRVLGETKRSVPREDAKTGGDTRVHKYINVHKSLHTK